MITTDTLSANPHKAAATMRDVSNVVLKDSHRDRRAAIAELYTAHAHGVFRWLGALGVPEADREDALHQVFLVAYRQFDTFEGRAAVTTWLFGIARRVAAAQRRRAHVRLEVGTDALHHAVDTTTRPDENAERAQAFAIIHTLLEGLDEPKRTAFVLYELDGMVAPSIAELMGCPVQTVYTRLRAARAHFERALATLHGTEKEKL